MAYTSLSELAAAMAPKVYGSSTIGVKKSTVCTRASSAVSLYTPASSAVSNPTSTFSSASAARAPAPGPKPLDSAWTLNPRLSRAPSACATEWFSHASITIIAGCDDLPSSAAVLLLAVAFTLVSREPQADPRLKKRFRAPRAERLDSGAPGRHARRDRLPARLPAGARNPGHLPAPSPPRWRTTRSKDWEFFREAAREIFWPHVEQRVSRRAAGHRRRREGARRASSTCGTWWRSTRGSSCRTTSSGYDKQQRHAAPRRPDPAEHCSAFVATGSYTKDGRVVIGHNNWTSYIVRRALEHHLRHHARARATASSWTACPG